MECQFCKNKFTNKQNLNAHQTKAKYCLKIQKKEPENEYSCDSCEKTFLSTTTLRRHEKTCSSKDVVKELKEEVKVLKEKYMLSEERCSMLREELEKSRNDYKELSITAVSRDFYDETTIEIDDTLSESQFSVEDSDSENEEEYKLTPLEMGQGLTIEHREEDGYINVTNLCKAGGKLFKNWKKTQKTKAFLQVLSRSVPNGTDLLIKTETCGLNENRGTWVHPQVAINIAQWISPHFDVKVSGWVYEIMMTGKVDITNTTSFKQLQKDNKDKQLKIQYLTKKYVKAQPRVQYEERNVVYILTTKGMKKERRYILGKATNLTSRLSVYNKSDEHEVMYYQGCGDEETMSLVENMVFKYLNEYREQANRERFVLPEEEEIKYFSDIIKKSVEFFKK
jgi:hypothetical protein